MRRIALAAGLFLMLVACASGQQIPKGYMVPDDTLSPDGRYGVTVPILAEHNYSDKSDQPKNSVIDMKSGHVLTVIQSRVTGYDHMNNAEVLPTRWSPDGTLMLWAVDGKWSLDSLVLLKIEDGTVKWQTDVLKTAQQAVLKRTKEGAPNMYAAAKKRNTPHGAAFPEGFVVDATAVSATGTLNSSTHFWVILRSDVKDMGSFPHLESHLEGLVDWQGKFTVKSFYYGAGKPIRDDDDHLIVTSVPHRQVSGAGN